MSIDKSNGNLRPWKKGQSGNPGGRPKQDPEIAREVREILGARLPEMAEKLGAMACNDAGDVPMRFQLKAIEIAYDRVLGRPEQKTTISGRVDYVAILQAFTTGLGVAKPELLEGECEVVEDSEAGARPSGNGEAEDQ